LHFAEGRRKRERAERERERGRERPGGGMSNWAIRKGLRSKDNEHLICSNSWPLFAGFESGVGAAVQQNAGGVATLFELPCQM